MANFSCNCGCEFKNELGYKIHITRKCDGGKYLEVIEKERMIAKPIDQFIDNLNIDNNTLGINDDVDRYEKTLLH